MKSLPNLITAVRLLAAVVLTYHCLYGRAETVFIPLFVVAGLSDLFDGIVARRFNLCTAFGARFDSISDLALYSSVLFFLIKHAVTAIQTCSGWIILGGLAQITHIAFSFSRHGSYPAYHSKASRGFAYLLFGGIILFWITRWVPALVGLSMAWLACSLEGIAITAALPRSEANVPNLFYALRLRRNADLKPKAPLVESICEHGS